MVRRAVRLNFRSSCETKHLKGDILFYKSSNGSHRKCTVTGQGGHQVFVKHGTLMCVSIKLPISTETHIEESSRRKESSTRKDKFIRQRQQEKTSLIFRNSKLCEMMKINVAEI